ncbi:MAG TPA: response regulator [Methylomirabilota bacterium]|jgi:CheY-like chemotaxis protein|nr:response regulator [Methylomirabilota bacterium]
MSWEKFSSHRIARFFARGRLGAFRRRRSVVHKSDGAQRRSPGDDSMTELQGLTILVVEDDEDTREVLKVMLEMCGARVLSAGSARDGLQAFTREHPQAIVSDIAMPGEDGYWLIGEVRRQLGVPPEKVPAVAVTAFSGQHPRAAALAAGFQAHLAKPIDPDELCRTVAKLVHA